jgi:hypothetical protein
LVALWAGICPQGLYPSAAINALGARTGSGKPGSTVERKLSEVNSRDMRRTLEYIKNCTTSTYVL